MLPGRRITPFEDHNDVMEAAMRKVKRSDRAVPGTEELAALDAHWRAANYLSVGQIYLLGNPLLR
ncbi:hypothetical protein ADK38_32500, partial [Streptomyces varsoviensis]